MTDLPAMLAAPGLEATAFPPTSRYYGVGVASFALPDGTTRAYLKRRFVPQAGDLQAIDAFRVAGAMRADTIAAAVFGDATQMWRLSDANGLDAQQLVARPGTSLTVAVPRVARSTASA
jgi:hypothetical protein